jgi:hypothetical protein
MADKLIRTIKAVSKGKLADGKIGFITAEEADKWYNTSGEPEALQGLMDTVIQKGNTIEFEMNGFNAVNFVLKEKAKQSEKGSFTDDMTSFEDLLNDAHDKFDWMSIKTEMIENDWEKKRAIFKATVQTCLNNETTHVSDDDEEVMFKQTFEAYGDATQENCGDMVKIHYIRMAETRAIARALRWATNNAKAAEEETENGELPESEEVDDAELAKP